LARHLAEHVDQDRGRFGVFLRKGGPARRLRLQERCSRFQLQRNERLYRRLQARHEGLPVGKFNGAEQYQRGLERGNVRVPGFLNDRVDGRCLRLGLQGTYRIGPVRAKSVKRREDLGGGIDNRDDPIRGFQPRPGTPRAGREQHHDRARERANDGFQNQIHGQLVHRITPG